MCPAAFAGHMNRPLLAGRDPDSRYDVKRDLDHDDHRDTDPDKDQNRNRPGFQIVRRGGTITKRVDGIGGDEKGPGNHTGYCFFAVVRHNGDLLCDLAIVTNLFFFMSNILYIMTNTFVNRRFNN